MGYAPMTNHKCALCGQIEFKTMHEYETHRLIYHGIKASIKPVNVTGRSKEQIIRDAEKTWLQLQPIHMEIVANNQQHLNACQCEKCTVKVLDYMEANIAEMEMIINQGGKLCLTKI